MQALTEFFEGFHCCDLVLELVPVDHRSWEEGVPVDLSGGSLHGFYCLHFEGDSLSLHPPSDGQSCITKKQKTWRVYCLAVCSAVSPIPDLLACGSHSQDSLLCNHSSQTWQPSSGFVQGFVCWMGGIPHCGVETYSRIGLAGCFDCFGTFRRLRLMKPSVLLRLAVTVSTCMFLERWLVTVTCMYLLDSSTARV